MKLLQIGDAQGRDSKEVCHDSRVTKLYCGFMYALDNSLKPIELPLNSSKNLEKIVIAS